MCEFRHKFQSLPISPWSLCYHHNLKCEKLFRLIIRTPLTARKQKKMQIGKYVLSSSCDNALFINNTIQSTTASNKIFLHSQVKTDHFLSPLSTFSVKMINSTHFRI